MINLAVTADLRHAPQLRQYSSTLPAIVSRPWDRRRSRAMMWWCFALGLGSATYLNLGLFLSFAETLMVLTGFLVLGPRANYLKKPVVARLLPLIGLMLISVPLSEFFNRTESWQFLRGIPRAYAFLFCFLVLIVVFSEDRRRIWPYLMGLSISQVVAMYYFKNGWLHYQEQRLGGRFGIDWKTGYNYPFTSLVLLIALTQYRKRPLLTVAIMMAAAAVHLVMGSRSPGLCTAIGAMLGLIRYARSRNVMATVPSRTIVAVALCIGVGVAAFAAYGLYDFAATQGWMSDIQRDKYLSESQGKYGILASSRGSVIATALAIYDRPFLGHGSWALDTGNYTQRADEILSRKRIAGNKSGRISFHSLLLGDWMQWGIVFGVFWFWMLCKAVWFLLLGIQRAGPDTAFFGALFCLLIWDILFSPVGNRTVTAAFTAILVATPYLQAPYEGGVFLTRPELRRV